MQHCLFVLKASLMIDRIVEQTNKYILPKSCGRQTLTLKMTFYSNELHLNLFTRKKCQFLVNHHSCHVFLVWLPHCLPAYLLREAFQSKNQRNLGISPNRGGGGRQKSPKFQLGKVQNQRGVFGNQKSPKFQRVSRTEK